jgi:hypothetical protein
MADHPLLVNVDTARDLILTIDPPASRHAIDLIVGGFERFYSEQPSQLLVSLDMFFIVRILADCLHLVRATFLSADCTTDNWFDEDVIPKPAPIADADVYPYGVRVRQADNFLSAIDDSRLQHVILIVLSRLRARQTGIQELRGDGRGWIPMKSVPPKYPPDYLFIAMALRYTLKHGAPARVFLMEIPADSAAVTSPI